jgi:hypothetical protein
VRQSAADEPARHTNRLARESSPYLQQHAHNPVDWYPWGPEAFEAARAQDKCIFLSVGYSTCYWCHVMERQCFENPAVAQEMNRRFISIKVDREQRPDVDQLYMTAVQVLTRHGGWPMSVWLTPDLRPFYGGTYFPPEDSHGRAGFVSVLRGLDEAYRQRRGDVERTANQLTEILRQFAEPPGAQSPIRVDHELIGQVIDRSTADYDSSFGGFGPAPKFPRQTLLELLLRYLAAPDQAGDSLRRTQVRAMLVRTMDAMAAGGIRDHLGGGFHRYSTDQQWLVPHFEIMLYDNAMLAWCYAELCRQTQDHRDGRIARGICDFVIRELTSPLGLFYTAFDAEVDAREGLSYLWNQSQVIEVLGPKDADLFCRVYGLDRGPNFVDPHHGSGRPEANVLYVADAVQAEVRHDELEAMRRKLYEVRRGRKQPLLDTKIITSWNALMIRALAMAGRVLHEPIYLQAATRAAEALLERHRRADGSLVRASGGVGPAESTTRGFLDDYAMLIQALLALHGAEPGGGWIEHARSIAQSMLKRFGDEVRGALYFTDREADDLVVRQKTGSDSPLPSGNAVAAMALIDLGEYEPARSILASFAPSMLAQGEGMSAMVQASMDCVQRCGPFDARPGPESVDRPESSQEAATSAVQLSAQWQSDRRLVVNVRIAGGFHINGHEPAEGLIATTLTVSGDGSDVVSIEYPPAASQTMAFSDQPVPVYSGEIRIVVSFRSPPAGPLRLALNYQACTDSSCLKPSMQQIDIAP